MIVRVTVFPAPGPAVPPRSAVAVVIDVLRATTTLSHALANGADRVIPAGSPEEARALRDAHPGWLLCGERDGRRLPGFDLGNSPAEYGAERVRGRTLVFASTNGSLAMRRALRARRVLLGAFVDAAAVVEAVRGEREVVLVCAGKLGGFCLEDAACAGWIAARLAERGAHAAGPGSRLARALAPPDAAGVRAVVQGCAHGRYLRSLGPEFARDVEACGALDALSRAFAL